MQASSQYKKSKTRIPKRCCRKNRRKVKERLKKPEVTQVFLFFLFLRNNPSS
jgi:hypothetical protein